MVDLGVRSILKISLRNEQFYFIMVDVECAGRGNALTCPQAAAVWRWIPSGHRPERLDTASGSARTSRCWSD